MSVLVCATQTVYKSVGKSVTHRKGIFARSCSSSIRAEWEGVAHSSFLANTPLFFHSIFISHPASKDETLS